MRNLHKFILKNYGIGLLRLLRDWEKFQLRQCNFKNHRIFTLRCIHSELVPVSIRLKSTLKSERAKKILRTAEKQLLQTRLNSINSLLDNNAKQLELTRSKIVSILTPPNYQQCQECIEKIKEKRFIKVGERQVRKLNNLINKKEGGITWKSSQVFLATRAFPLANNRQAGNNVQAGRLTPRASPKASQEDSVPPGNTTYQAGNPQSTQAGSSQPSLGERACPQSHFSQVGSSQASLVDSTLSLAESELSQASSPSSPEDSTLQVESTAPHQAVRCLARLRARQAGTPLGRSVQSLSGTVLFPKEYFPRTMLPKKQGLSPVGTTPCRDLPPQRNLIQRG